MARRVCPVAVLCVAAMIGTGIFTVPAEARRPPAIYRVRITIRTTSSASALSLLSPATFIVGRSRMKGPGGFASFGGFGAGPLRVQKSGGSHSAAASFVVALTPSGAKRLRFASVKGRSGSTTIKIENLNRATKVRRIRLVGHHGYHGSYRTFSIPTRRFAVGGPAPKSAPLQPKVLAFYYSWYKLAHWVGGSLARYNRNDDPYDSGDPSAIGRHIRQAQDAGIDAFLVSWWGRGSFINDNVRTLYRRLKGTGIKAAIYFETRSDAFTSKKRVVKQLKYVLDKYASKPHYLRYQGKPVIYFYSTQHVLRGESGSSNPAYLRVWRNIFKRLRRSGHRFKAVGMATKPGDLGIFDGLHIYSTRTTRTLNRQMTLTTRAYASVHGGGRRVWGTTVAPGYDDRHLTGRSTTTYVPRGAGYHYRTQWSAAIGTFSDQALILSFNEWFETTNIEPNHRWGDKYLRITREKAGRYKRTPR